MPRRLISFLLTISLCACSAGHRPAQNQAATQDTTTPAPPATQVNAALSPAVAKDTAVSSQEEEQEDALAPVLPDSAYVFLKVSAAGEPKKYLRLLHPEAFPQLPQNVSAWLTANGYLIVQSTEPSRPYNVISGEYIRPGEKDWAVLAYKDSTISIIVFWSEGGQDKHAVVEKNSYEDKTGFIAYTDILETVPASYLKKYTDWSDSLPAEVVLDHEAVGTVDGDFCYYYCDEWWYTAIIYDEVNRRDVREEGILRLPPSDFPQLPASISRWLDHNGYTVPQSFVSHKPNNVIAGEFKQKGRTDWAVLASKDSVTSSVIMFWNGSVDSVEFISPQPDSIF